MASRNCVSGSRLGEGGGEGERGGGGQGGRDEARGAMGAEGWGWRLEVGGCRERGRCSGVSGIISRSSGT